MALPARYSQSLARRHDGHLIGNNQLTDLTPSGLWPADHAGVVAILRIGGNVFDPLETMETDSETGSGFKR